MEDSARFRVNSPQIADEVIEQEVIIINLATGNYYNLLDVGADVWQLLRQGATFGEMLQTIRTRYQGDPGQMQESVSQFVSELQREGLVIPTDETENSPVISLPETAPRPFQPPQLNVYIDMQKMILLDPIHEVDEMGWPSPQNNQG